MAFSAHRCVTPNATTDEEGGHRPEGVLQRPMRNLRTLRTGDRSTARLRTERLTARAIEAAADFLPSTLIESGEAFDVVAACQRLLSAKAMIGVSISRVDSGNVSKVIAVGAAVFLSDEAASDIARHPIPGASERILWSAGHGPAVPLDAQQIDALNAHHGLNVFVVLHHQTPGLTPDDQVQVRARLTAAFLEDMRGYRLREVLADGLEDELADWAIPGGFRVRNAYDDWYRTHVEPRPRRVLIGLERNDAIALVGTVLGLLFQYQPPRLGFSASQRRVLAEAVQHKTDAEIASELQVSVSAVKKTWAAIFEQASDVLGELGTAIERHGAAATRGLQKRHKLLAYLREHPEELKP